MKYKIVAIRDRVGDCFSIPNFVPNHGAAIRAFGDEVRRVPTPDRPNQLYDHADDFDLFALGEYDDDTASFDAILPAQLALGKDYK